MLNAIDQFRTAISEAGLSPPETIYPDGSKHRFSTNGRPSDTSGWYVFHADGIPAGAFGDWRIGLSKLWRADMGRSLTPKEEAAHRERLEAIKRERKTEEARIKKEARKTAATIWDAARPVPVDHAYLLKKGIKAHGLRLHGADIVIPMYECAELHSLQFISPDGGKRFLTGGRVNGCYFFIGEPEKTLNVVEGYATGASIHEATGTAVAVAFNAGNLSSVVKSLRAKYPNIRLTICADDDVQTKGNPGLTKAREAAEVAAGLLAIPDFGVNRQKGVSDFNDLHKHGGLDAVRVCIERAIPVTVGAAQEESPSEEEESKERKLNQADKLIQLAQDARLFHDTGGIGFADTESSGHRETLRIRSQGFRVWLTFLYFQKTGLAPNSDALQKAVDSLEARAQYQAPQRAVFLRVAEHEGRIFLDIGNPVWNSVEIDTQGWKISSSPPVRFRRTKGMKALPIPRAGGEINALRQFLNLKDDSEFVLVVSWLLAAMRNCGPYPILILTGEQGSAKSTFAKILRTLIDPNSAPLRALPREERDLFITTSNAHCLAFDNLSGLSPWISDALCRIATGGGFAARQLYSDDEETLFDAARPIILNGIEDIVSRPDLADRAIFVTLEPIPEDKRRAERELWDKFEAEKPGILGALMDAVSCGLRELPNTRLSNLPRMADFALWASACETAFWPAGTFMQAFDRNRADAVQNVLEGDPVAVAVRRLMEGREQWKGTSSDLLEGLAQTMPEAERKSKGWPDSPRSLSGRLKRAATFLRGVGLNVSYERTGKARMISIVTDRVGNSPSLLSPTSLSKDNPSLMKELTNSAIRDVKDPPARASDGAEVDW